MAPSDAAALFVGRSRSAPLSLDPENLSLLGGKFLIGEQTLRMQIDEQCDLRRRIAQLEAELAVARRAAELLREAVPSKGVSRPSR